MRQRRHSHKFLPRLQSSMGRRTELSFQTTVPNRKLLPVVSKEEFGSFELKNSIAISPSSSCPCLALRCAALLDFGRSSLSLLSVVVSTCLIRCDGRRVFICGFSKIRRRKLFKHTA